MSANSLPPIPVPGSLPGAPGAAASRFKPIDPVRVLRQHVKLLSVTAVVGVVVGVGTWFGLKETVPRWASSAQLRVSEGIAMWIR